MPVLPLVGSTRVDSPGRICPERSAASIIDSAMRSLTEPPGFIISRMAQIEAIGGTRFPSASRLVTLRNRTNGVLPIIERMLSLGAVVSMGEPLEEEGGA